jgi:hypothetical protein
LITYKLGAQTVVDAKLLRKSTLVNIEVEGENLLVTELHDNEKIFYRDFEKYSRESIYYSEMDPITNLEAKTQLPKKSKELKVSTIETKDVISSGIFFDDFKRKDFVYVGLAPEAVGKLKYTKKLKYPHLIAPFIFSEPNMDVDLAEYVVTAPPNVSIEYKILGIPEHEVSFSKIIGPDQIRYSWLARQVKPFQKEKDSPASLYSLPHLLIYVKSFKTKKGEHRVLTDSTDLFKWNSGMFDQTPATNETFLKPIVNSIIESHKTDEAKIEAIYQWVQSNISYIAFEYGLAGFVPRSASDVCTKKYGDCKDMANLLKEMIRLAGFDAHVAWIGSRARPYTFATVPTPRAIDHMICVVPVKGKNIFLDATNSYGKFGTPTSMIQGKEAMIELGNSKFEIVKVPETDRTTNQRLDTIRVSLNNQLLQGSLTSTMSGYKKDELESDRLKNQVDKTDDHFEDFLKIGNNNIIFSNVSINGLGVQNKSAITTLKFQLPQYIKTIGDKIYINLNLTKSVPGEKVDVKSRKQQIERKYKYENKLVVTFALPETLTVNYLPKDENLKWNHFGISTHYQLTNNVILFEKTFYSDVLYLQPTDFEEWNTVIQTVSDIEKQTITLSKKN